MQDSLGGVCVSYNSTQFGNHSAQFENDAGVRIMGIANQDGLGGFIKLERIRLTTGSPSAENPNQPPVLI